MRSKKLHQHFLNTENPTEQLLQNIGHSYLSSKGVKTLKRSLGVLWGASPVSPLIFYTPLLPLARTGGRLPAFGVNRRMSHRVGGRVRSGGAGPGPPLAAVPLRTPRAARRANVAHGGHSELTFRAVSRSRLHRFGFLEGFSWSPHWFWLDNFYGCHCFLVLRLRPQFMEETRHLVHSNLTKT